MNNKNYVLLLANKMFLLVFSSSFRLKSNPWLMLESKDSNASWYIVELMNFLVLQRMMSDWQWNKCREQMLCFWYLVYLVTKWAFGKGFGRWREPGNMLQKMELELLCCHNANFRPFMRLKLFNLGPDSFVVNLPIIGSVGPLLRLTIGLFRESVPEARDWLHCVSLHKLRCILNVYPSPRGAVILLGASCCRQLNNPGSWLPVPTYACAYLKTCQRTIKSKQHVGHGRKKHSEGRWLVNWMLVLVLTKD